MASFTRQSSCLSSRLSAERATADLVQLEILSQRLGGSCLAPTSCHSYSGDDCHWQKLTGHTAFQTPNEWLLKNLTLLTKNARGTIVEE